ncbi:hypothetical protein [Streptomyces alboniger]|uniref:hypothetical protein n=1 Tax=Streptomyces alboniger TaxID=132473 RepID=UPI00142F0549|nr:hypothetical protein [Streptomyces alboniger]
MTDTNKRVQERSALNVSGRLVEAQRESTDLYDAHDQPGKDEARPHGLSLARAP